ncbi:ribosome recycling factor [bacterium]|jgi:ribosome recycling factor|nr:ribosome recycling factor [bacterium]MBT5015296.1 ribosome recycling factor [bacterium]
MFKNIKFEENNTKSFETVVNEEMEKSIKHFRHNIASIRAGRANPGMVEDIKVLAYEGTTEMKLRELASISTPDALQIIIQPWDKSTLVDIEKAIMNSEVGVTPQTDGELIRLRLPEMSSERRDELKKLLHKRLEECKIAIRNVRKDAHNSIRDAQRAKDISEDFSKRLNDDLQKITDKFTELSNQVSQKKESEITG